MALGMTRSHSLQLLRDVATEQRKAFSAWFCGATTVTEDAGLDYLVPWGLLETMQTAGEDNQDGRTSELRRQKWHHLVGC